MKLELSSIKALFCILAIGLGSASCNKTNSSNSSSNNNNNNNNNSGGANQTIGAQLLSATGFNLLRQAAVSSGVITKWESAGPFTVFAPNDSAFGRLGIDSTALSTYPSAVVATILNYHTLTSQISSTQLPAGPNAKVITANGDSVFITRNANGIFVNGKILLSLDLPASNGVIHTIKKPLIPSFGQNLFQLVVADTNFTLLAAAIVRASQGTTNWQNQLSGGAIYTLLAPINDAFRIAGFPDTATINAASPTTMANMIAYHLIAGRVFSSDFFNGGTFNAVNGESLTFTSLPNSTVKGKTNPSASNIFAFNQVATNGVAFDIDQVLMP